MKTYIANCTVQRQIVNYRMPESAKPIQHAIPEGKQLFLGDLSPPEIDAIVAQLGPYGLILASELGRSSKKVTYVLSSGQPVSADHMRRAFDQNRGILRDEGTKRRTEAAIAANANMNTEQTPLNKLEMSVEEESSGSFPSDEPIAEGIKIDNTLKTSENRPPRRKVKPA